MMQFLTCFCFLAATASAASNTAPGDVTLIDDNTDGTATITLFPSTSTGNSSPGTSSSAVTVQIHYREAIFSGPHPEGHTSHTHTHTNEDSSSSSSSSTGVEYTWSDHSYCSLESTGVLPPPPPLHTSGLIIRRGGCAFSDKIAAAATAGATHILLADAESALDNANGPNAGTHKAETDVYPIMGDVWYGGGGKVTAGSGSSGGSGGSGGSSRVRAQPWVASISAQAWAQVQAVSAALSPPPPPAPLTTTTTTTGAGNGTGIGTY